MGDAVRFAQLQPLVSMTWIRIAVPCRLIMAHKELAQLLVNLVTVVYTLI